MGNEVDPLRDHCGIVLNPGWGEVIETRVFGSTDVRVRPVDKFNLRVAGLREALVLLERDGFAQVPREDRKRLAASGFQVWTLVFEWGEKQVTWYLVKKVAISSKTRLRDGENRDLPSLSGEICTNTLSSAPQHHLSKHPLRKGLKENARVRRACRDPRVYLRTRLYKPKGSVDVEHVHEHGVETATKVCSDHCRYVQLVLLFIFHFELWLIWISLQTGEAVPEQDPLATNKERSRRRVKRVGKRKPAVTNERKESCATIITPTLDLSAKV